MSKFNEAVDSYKKHFTGERGVADLDETLLTAVAKGLGPSIYLADASLVSCSDDTELNRVREKFLIGKLGLSDGPELDAALKSVCEQLSHVPRKPRAVFYYLLVKHFGKESMYV